MMPTADNSPLPAERSAAHNRRLARVAGVVSAPATLDVAALVAVLHTILGREPLVPNRQDDPFAVLQKLQETAADHWLLVTEEPAAHRGHGNHWCAAMAAFRRPVLLVFPAVQGWEGRARAYGALAGQTGVPLLGVASQGEHRPEGFNPARDLGLPWIGCFPTDPSLLTADSSGDERLWWIRERIHRQWRTLLAVGALLPVERTRMASPAWRG